MRHSNVARQLDIGTRAQVLSDLLGHRDSESVLTYARIATQPLREVSLPVAAMSTKGAAALKEAQLTHHAELVAHRDCHAAVDARHPPRRRFLQRDWMLAILVAQEEYETAEHKLGAPVAHAHRALEQQELRGVTGQRGGSDRAASYQVTRWYLVEAATKHEGRRIWGAILRALTLVLCCTGIRLGEAVRLRIDDVDLRQDILTGD